MIGKKWKLYKKLNIVITKQAKYDKPGRPSGNEPIGYTYKAKVEWKKDELAVQVAIHKKSSFVLATNMAEQDLADEDIVSCYKNQQCVERGYRFLKDPLFFANGFYLKKPSRISALIMIMTLSLLVYTIAQKKLREAMKEKNVKLPNQIGKLVTNLTMRRVFQILQGIHFVKTNESDTGGFVQGLNSLQQQIIELIDGKGLAIYQLHEANSNDQLVSVNQLESIAI